MLFNPEIETLSREKLRKLQSERLSKQVAYLYEKVPFYKRKFDEKGLKPGDIRSIADIHRIPLSFKTDLRDEYPFGFFTAPAGKMARIHCSSGTTGKPVVVGYSRDDLEIFSEVVARSLAAAGAKPGMMLHNAYGYGLFTGGLGLHSGAEKLGMTVVPISGGMTDRQLMLLRDFKPEVICCTPSYAQTLAHEARVRGMERFNLKYAVLGAEPWNEAIRADVEKGLQVSATNIYGLSEIIGPGVSQEDFEEKGTGSYVWEDHFFPEIIDPKTHEPLEEGKTGVLVFTNLSKSGMAMLRYVTNDITFLRYDSAGKRTHVKMGPIVGRNDDMLIIRGVNFFPSQIEELVNGFTELAPFFLLTVDFKEHLDTVSIDVEVAREVQLGPAERGNLAEALSRKVKDTIGVNVSFHVRDFGSIPRSEGGKISKVKDLRKLKT